MPNVFFTAFTTVGFIVSSKPNCFLRLTLSAGLASSTRSVTSSVVVSVTPLASVTSNVNSVSNIRLAASIALLSSWPCT